jgi:hypothetical protein
MTRYTKEDGRSLYDQGYRYVLHEQYGRSVALKEMPACPWGHGVFRINADGSMGECVGWNYDDSM